LAGLDRLRLGIFVAGEAATPALSSLARLTKIVAGAGGTVVIPQQAALLSGAYLAQTLGDRPAAPSIAYAEPVTSTGLHLMETPTEDWTEILTGLGATGVEIILAYVGEHPAPGHPLVPLLQVSAEPVATGRYGQDLDLILTSEPESWPAQMLDKIIDTISRRYRPRLLRQGNVDFQITRGLLGVSL